MSVEELQKLAGEWELIGGENEGAEIPEELRKTCRLTIAGNKHTVIIGDDTMVGTHELDPGQQPCAIDSIDTEGPFTGRMQGIYELTPSGEFRVCFARPGEDRPTEFSSKSGTGQLVHVWKRRS